MVGVEHHTEQPEVEIDEGIRKWYQACACCLGDTYPTVKKVLDAERKESKAPPPKSTCEEMGG